jgi:hypothetical protein
MAGRYRALLVLSIALLAPSAASAGPYFGEWGWFWQAAPDCPCGEYSPWHYWAPEMYRLRGCLHPSNLDQYPPGIPGVPAPIFLVKYPCRTAPPAPTAPYADPVAYYGRPVASAVNPVYPVKETGKREDKPPETAPSNR